jgi:hypothetical protein
MSEIRGLESWEAVEKAYLEKLARWMIQHGFATGHGDSFDDLLEELSWQVKERADLNVVRRATTP